MTAQPRASDVLAELFAPVEGYVELRAKGTCTIEQAFAPTTEVAALAPFVAKHRDAAHLYFGGSARRTPDDGTRANCSVLSLLWADLDGPLGESRARLARFPFPANVVTHTGRGLQPAWALKEGLDLEAGGRLPAPAGRVLQRRPGRRRSRAHAAAAGLVELQVHARQARDRRTLRPPLAAERERARRGAAGRSPGRHQRPVRRRSRRQRRSKPAIATARCS